jgi:hypothetical protein
VELKNEQIYGSWANPKFGSRYQLPSIVNVTTIDIESSKTDCLRFVVCPLLAQLITGFFSSFSAAAIHSTKEANKAGGTCH